MNVTESLYLHNKVNSEETMKKIESMYGPFDEKEIEFYLERTDGIVYQFQKKMVFDLFYKYFGDTNAIKAINNIDRIKLTIAAKNIMINAGMYILPYIISSKTKRQVGRKILNSKELQAVKSSELYSIIREKYKSDKIDALIEESLATILASEFEIIDYHNEDLDGTSVIINPVVIREEVLKYINAI